MTSEAYRYLMEVELFKIASYNESASTPYGMQIKRVENFGLFVINVISNSIAHGAGIRFGDVITHINNIDTKSENLATSIAAKIISKDSSVVLRIIKQPSYSLVRETRDEKWGFAVEDNIVSSNTYINGSPAEKANLPLYQAIVSINGVEAACLNDEHLKTVLRRADKQLRVRVMDASFYIEFLRCLGLEVESSPEKMARVFDPSRIDKEEHQMLFTECNTTSSGVGFTSRREGFVVANRDSLSQEKLKKNGKGENVKMWWISNTPISDSDDSKQRSVGSPLTRLFKGMHAKKDKRAEACRKNSCPVIGLTPRKETAPEAVCAPSSDVLNLFGDSQILLNALEASQPPSARMVMSSDRFNTEDLNEPPTTTASSAVPTQTSRDRRHSQAGYPKAQQVTPAARVHSGPSSAGRSATVKGWQKPQYKLESSSEGDTRDCEQTLSEEALASRDTLDSGFMSQSRCSTFSKSDYELARKVNANTRRMQPHPASPKQHGSKLTARPRPSPRQNESVSQQKKQPQPQPQTQTQTVLVRGRRRNTSDTEQAQLPLSRPRSIVGTNTHGEMEKGPAYTRHNLKCSVDSDVHETTPDTTLYARRHASDLLRRPQRTPDISSRATDTPAAPPIVAHTPPHIGVAQVRRRSVSTTHPHHAAPRSPVPTHRTGTHSLAQSPSTAIAANTITTRSYSAKASSSRPRVHSGTGEKGHNTPDNMSQQTKRPPMRKTNSLQTPAQPAASPRPRAESLLGTPQTHSQIHTQTQSQTTSPAAPMRVYVISPNTVRKKKSTPRTPKRPDQPQSHAQPQSGSVRDVPKDAPRAYVTQPVRHSRETTPHLGALSRAQYQAETLITSHVVQQYAQHVRNEYVVGQTLITQEVYSQPIKDTWKPDMRGRSKCNSEVQVNDKAR